MEYLTHDGRYWACDIEANDLRDEATVIHCVCVEKLQDGERLSFFQKEDFKAWLEAEDRILIGHNFLAYDAPVLNRLWQAKVKVSQIIDTFLLSQVYAPNLAGGHSLDAWGQRLGDHKIAFSDFSHYTPEMLLYCQQDVSLTKKVYLALTKRLKGEGFTERGIELEHLAWNIIQNKQKRNGFPFNQEKADLLYAELRTREEQLKKEIYRLWPPVLECVRTFARGFKSDGTRTKGYLGHLGQYPKLEDNPDGSYNAYDYVEFDLGSPKQRIQKLLDLGWEPVNFTEKGNPKVDEDEMIAFAEYSGIKEAKALAEWVVTNARANMIRNWQQAVKQETGHIHGSLFLASTLRYKHSKPNTANIPGNEAQYGEACRNLWDCGDEKEWSLVGIDAKGIQLRILAHYLDVPSFTEAILSEDPHTANQREMGLPSRSLTKTITYAAIMGSGVALMAQTAGVTLPEARRYKDMFFKGLGLDQLISRLQDDLKIGGRITLCTGNKLLVPSDHMVIPYLLQGDESQIMKLAMVMIDREVRRREYSRDILQVGMIHDELQFRVRAGLEEEFVALALPCFEEVGRKLRFNLPIEGDAKIGKAWNETH